jgi:hypothetical protein
MHPVVILAIIGYLVEICALLEHYRSVEWQFCTDVSGQPICPMFKGLAAVFRMSNYLTSRLRRTRKNPL